MKAYHVYAVNSDADVNYVTFSKENAMKDQSVFIQVDEIEIRDMPYDAFRHNQLLNEVKSKFNSIFVIEPKMENLVEIITKLKECFNEIDAMKK